MASTRTVILFQYKISVRITHVMTKYFDQRMYSAGHHDMKHLINGDETLSNSAGGFLDYTNAKLFHFLLLQISSVFCPSDFLLVWSFVFALIPICAKCSGKSHQTLILLKPDVACGWSLNSPAPCMLKSDRTQRYSELNLGTVRTPLLV